MTGLELRKRKATTWNQYEEKLATEKKESTKDFLKRVGKKMDERKMNNEVQRKNSSSAVEERKKANKERKR